MTLHQGQNVSASGPWPFVTRRETLIKGRRHVWQSRTHRKGLHEYTRGTGPSIKAMLWSPGQLNWWIGVGFSMGALIFALGSVLSLAPDLVRALQMTARQVNAVYFIGSIFFTSAAGLQLNQAANAGEAGPGDPHRHRRVLIGWRPSDAGWLASFLQFLGTLLFNFSTFAASAGAGNWLWQDMTIWSPDAAGSILFMVSGYLGFIEACHRHWAWNPQSLSWWIVFANLSGCVAFVIAMVFAYIPSGGAAATEVELSVVFTLIGALWFLVGSVLLLPEGTTEP